MKKRLICLLTAALLLPSQAMAVYETDGMNFIGPDGNIKFFDGYNIYNQTVSREMVDSGANILQVEMGPRSTIVSEEFEIPSWTPTTADRRMAKIDSGSLKLSGTSAYDGTYSEMSQSISVLNDKYYRIEFDVKGVNALGNIVVANGIEKFLPTGTYDWQRVGFTVSSSSTSMDIAFRSYNTTDGIWIDNITVTELGGQYNVINNGDFEQVFPDEGFLVNDGAINYVKSLMADYESKGMNAVVLLSPHYIPEWFWTNYPEAYYYQEGFLEGDVTDATYLKFIKTHVQAMAEAVLGFDSFHSFVLTNEPVYNTSYYSTGKGHGFEDDFIAYLKNRYGEGTLGFIPEQLRTNWDLGTLARWDDIDDDRESQNDIVSDGKFWDFMEFNDKIFGDFHKELADTVHAVDETLPVHTKLYRNVFSRDALDYGTDFEDLNSYFDYNGFDGGMDYNSSREGYLFIRMMEDFANSVSNKPTVNSENHIIPDDCTDYSEKHVLIAGADLWQGIIHGRTASVAWSWDYSPCLISKRPDVQEAIGTTLEDANRLAKEIEKVQNSDKNFYILYSKAGLLYNEDAYLSACYNAYEALWSLGQRASFITEKQIAAGKLPNDAVLVIPSTSNIDEDALANLNSFAGKTIVIGTAPSKNEYNRSISVSLKNATTVTDSIDSIRGAFEAEIDSLITLKDSDGNYLDLTDIRAVETEDGILINVCNNTWEEISGVSVYKDGVKLTGGVNLIDNSTVADTFTLDAFKPMLIEFSE